MILFVQPEDAARAKELSWRVFAVQAPNKSAPRRGGDAKPEQASEEVVKASAERGKR